MPLNDEKQKHKNLILGNKTGPTIAIVVSPGFDGVPTIETGNAIIADPRTAWFSNDHIRDGLSEGEIEQSGLELLVEFCGFIGIIFKQPDKPSSMASCAIVPLRNVSS